MYGKDSRLGGSLGKSWGSPWGSPWGKPGESLGKESRLQDFEKKIPSLCVSYSSGRTFSEITKPVHFEIVSFLRCLRVCRLVCSLRVRPLGGLAKCMGRVL